MRQMKAGLLWGSTYQNPPYKKIFNPHFFLLRRVFTCARTFCHVEPYNTNSYVDQPSRPPKPPLDRPQPWRPLVRSRRPCPPPSPLSAVSDRWSTSWTSRRCPICRVCVVWRRCRGPAEVGGTVAAQVCVAAPAERLTARPTTRSPHQGSSNASRGLRV